MLIVYAQIILAIYYTIADIVLLGQCFYYRGFTWRDEPTPAKKPASHSEANERTSLLDGSYHHERRGSDWSALSPAVPHIAHTPPPAPPTALQTILWNTMVVLMVVASGVLGWFLARKATKIDDGPPSDETLKFNVLGQFFGWLCAVSYIASRLPQLILNWRRKTTEGLSMLFFLFACLGNLTYVLSIFAYEPKCQGGHCAPGEARRIYARYMLVNLSWLAGALVTLLLDLGVFAQYFIYSSPSWENDVSNAISDGEDDESIDEDRWDQRPILSRHDST